MVGLQGQLAGAHGSLQRIGLFHAALQRQIQVAHLLGGATSGRFQLAFTLFQGGHAGALLGDQSAASVERDLDLHAAGDVTGAVYLGIDGDVGLADEAADLGTDGDGRIVACAGDFHPVACALHAHFCLAHQEAALARLIFPVGL